MHEKQSWSWRPESWTQTAWADRKVCPQTWTVALMLAYCWEEFINLSFQHEPSVMRICFLWKRGLYRKFRNIRHIVFNQRAHITGNWIFFAFLKYNINEVVKPTKHIIHSPVHIWKLNFLLCCRIVAILVHHARGEALRCTVYCCNRQILCLYKSHRYSGIHGQKPSDKTPWSWVVL